MKIRGGLGFLLLCLAPTAWGFARSNEVMGQAASPTLEASPSAPPNKPVFIDSPSHQLSSDSGSGSATSETKHVRHSAVFSAAGVGTASAAMNGRKTQTGSDVAESALHAANNAAASASSKSSRSTSSLSRQGKLVYVSLDISPVFNWYAYVNNPFNRKGCQVFVNPAVAVDFDLGYYMMLGTGLALNTTGGRLQFTSDYVRELERLGFSCYDKVLRTYTVSYLELPLTFKMQGPITSNWQFFGSVGGYFGVRVWAQYRDRFDDFKSPDYASNPIGTVHQIDGTLIRKGRLDKELNRWNVATGLRLGAVYSLSSAVALRFGMGYRYGFLDAFSKYHERPNGVEPTLKPQQIEAFVGFTF